MKNLIVLSVVLFSLSACKTQKTQTEGATEWHDFGGKRYAFLTHIKPSIEQAREACSALDAALVRIDSAEENEFVRSRAFAGPLPNTADGDQFWLGGNDQRREGSFVWEQGQSQFWPKPTPLYSNWGSTTKGSQPNNFFKNNEDEDCIVIRENGDWYDIGCVTRFSFPICEKGM